MEDPTICEAERLLADLVAEIRAGKLPFDLDDLAAQLRGHADGVDGFEQAARIVEAVSSGVDPIKTSIADRDDILGSIQSGVADRAFDT